MPTRPAPKAKPKPGSKVNPRTAATIGNEAKKSRQQAGSASERSAKGQDEVFDSGSWIFSPEGKPLVKLDVAAAELVPVGQFANVSIGPARITMFIDPDDPAPISSSQRENIAAALNLLVEIAEMDVIAENRDMIIESVGSNK